MTTALHKGPRQRYLARVRAKRVLEEAQARIPGAVFVPEEAKPLIGTALDKEDHDALVDFIVDHNVQAADHSDRWQIPARNAECESDSSGTTFKRKTA